MTERSKADKTGPAKNNNQTIAVAVVLAVFVVGGLLLVNWRSIFPAEAPVNSIAVLPFENPRQDGYAGNIAESLTTSLVSNISQASTFPLVPMNDVMRYRAKNNDPQTLGKALKARAVVTGTVLREGDNVTIKVQLIDVKTGTSSWTNQYVVSVAEVNKVPEEIARQVIAAVSNAK